MLQEYEAPQPPHPQPVSELNTFVHIVIKNMGNADPAYSLSFPKTTIQHSTRPLHNWSRRTYISYNYLQLKPSETSAMLLTEAFMHVCVFWFGVLGFRRRWRPNWIGWKAVSTFWTRVCLLVALIPRRSFCFGPLPDCGSQLSQPPLVRDSRTRTRTRTTILKG